MVLIQQPTRRRALAHGAFLALALALTYSGSFDGQFVSDDVRAVRDNERIRSLAPGHVASMLTSFYDASYVPVTELSLALDHALFGPEPFGFHVTNLILHLVCTLLVYAILARLGLGATAAALVALLWAVHPIQVESVAWISERKNVLSGTFLLGAFLAHLGWRERPRPALLAGVFLLYGLALLSKLVAVVLPVLCLAHAFTVRSRLERRDGIVAGAMLLLAALALTVNLVGSPVHGTSRYHGGSPLVTWMSSSVVVLRYLGHIVWPRDLAYAYDVVLHGSPFALPVLAGTATVAFGLAGALVLMRRGRLTGFWLLWFFACLAPMLNLIPFRSMMQDRYLYLALLGPLAAVATVAAPRLRAGPPAAAAVAAALVLAAVFAGLSHRQVETWSDRVSLDQQVARSYAILLGPPGMWDPFTSERPAKLAFLEARLQEDPSAVIHNNLGGLLYQQGRLEEALVHLERARELDPRSVVVRLALARAYLQDQRIEAALAELEVALERRPLHPLAHMNRAVARALAGDPDGAEQAAQEAVAAGLEPERVRRFVSQEIARLHITWRRPHRLL